MKTYIIFIYLIFAAILIADDDYKMPPKAIVDIVDAPKTPNTVSYTHLRAHETS